LLPIDDEVVRALKKGDELMFEKLFKHYYNLLCNYVQRIVTDHDEAEEIVQQTMIKIWERRASMEITVSLKSYLYRAVHNAALNKIRQTKVRNLYAQEQVTLGTGNAEPASHKVLKGELEKEIAVAISLLPEQCRMVFKLSRFEQMKYHEIAQHLGISVKTVENHMGKALKLMREYLKDYLILILALMPWLL